MRWADMEAAASGDDYAAAVEADDTASAAAGAESAGGHHEAGHTVSGLHGPLRCADKRDGQQLSLRASGGQARWSLPTARRAAALRRAHLEGQYVPKRSREVGRQVPAPCRTVGRHREPPG